MSPLLVRLLVGLLGYAVVMFLLEFLWEAWKDRQFWMKIMQGQGADELDEPPYGYNRYESLRDIDEDVLQQFAEFRPPERRY